MFDESEFLARFDKEVELCMRSVMWLREEHAKLLPLMRDPKTCKEARAKLEAIMGKLNSEKKTLERIVGD